MKIIQELLERELEILESRAELEEFATWRDTEASLIEKIDKLSKELAKIRSEKLEIAYRIKELKTALQWLNG